MHTVNYKALLTSAGEGAHGGFRKWETITESPVLITGFGASEAKQHQAKERRCRYANFFLQPTTTTHRFCQPWFNEIFCIILQIAIYSKYFLFQAKSGIFPSLPRGRHDLKNRKVYLSNPLDDAFLVIHLLFASESLRAMYEIGKSPLIKLNDPKIESTQVRSFHCRTTNELEIIIYFRF